MEDCYSDGKLDKIRKEERLLLAAADGYPGVRFRYG